MSIFSYDMDILFQTVFVISCSRCQCTYTTITNIKFPENFETWRRRLLFIQPPTKTVLTTYNGEYSAYILTFNTHILEIHACNGGGGLDRGGGVVVTKMFPDVQKYFRTYNNFSENTVVFQFTFSCPENYLNSPENLLKFYINLSALEI